MKLIFSRYFWAVLCLCLMWHCAALEVPLCSPGDGMCPVGTECNVDSGVCEAAAALSSPLGNPGIWSSSVLTETDGVWVASYDVKLRSLFVQRRDSDGALQETQFVDGGAFDTGDSDVGAYPSIVLGTDGILRVAYYDASGLTLRIATKASKQWNVTTLTSVDERLGRWSSLALDASNAAYVAYRNDTHRRMEVTSVDNDVCRVDFSDPVNQLSGSQDYGEFSSIGIAGSSVATARVVVSFYDRTKGNLILATCLGDSIAYQIIDGENAEDGTDTGDVGLWSTLKVNPKTGNPSGAYFDRSRGILKYFESQQGEIDIDIVDDGDAGARIVGQNAALDYSAGNSRPRIVYLDATTQKVMFAYRSEHGTWRTLPIPTPDFDGLGGVGLGLDLAVSKTDSALVTFSRWSSGSGSLQIQPLVARCTVDEPMCEIKQ